MPVLDENPFLAACKHLSQIQPADIFYSDGTNEAQFRKLNAIRESDFFEPYEYSHPHVEICLCLAGEVVLRIEDVPWVMRAGQMMVIQPGLSHCEGRVARDLNYRVLWLTISDFSVMGFWCDYDRTAKWRTRDNFGVKVPCIEELRKQLRTGNALGNDEYELLRDTLIVAIATAKLTQFTPGKNRALRPTVVEKHLQTISAVKAYIETHYAEKIDISDLTSWAGFSQCYLYRLFRAQTGLSIHAFQTACRMNHAREFLKTGMSVKATAFEVGYDDPLYFSKVYKKHFGQPPSTPIHGD